MKEPLRNFAYIIVIIIGLGWICKWGAFLLVPFLFASFLSMALNPIHDRILRWTGKNWLSTFGALLGLILPVLVLVFLLSWQLVDIVSNLSSINEKIITGTNRVWKSIQTIFPFLPANIEDLLPNTADELSAGPLGFIRSSVVSTGNVLFAVLIVVGCTLFFLYYKNSFNNFIIYQFEKTNQSDVKTIMSQTKAMIQSYLGGLLIVIGILAVLNSLGLFLIGVKYALFWGVLAAVLAIIPYFGTTLGGTLPFLFTLANPDYPLQPVAVVAFYFTLQQIEGNIITPFIVGNKVDINPLVALLSIILIGSLWGVAGIVLALPLVSVTKIILSQFEGTKSTAILLSSSIGSQAAQIKDISESRERT